MIFCDLLRLFYDVHYRPLFNFFLRYTNFVSREKYALFQYSKKWILYWLDNFPNHKILSKKYKTFVKSNFSSAKCGFGLTSARSCEA